MYFQAKEVLLDEDAGLNVRKLKEDGFVGAEKVLVWWTDNDADTPGSHGKWLAAFFEAEERMLPKAHHTGACDWDHDQYLEALVRSTQPSATTQAEKVGKSNEGKFASRT